MTIAWKLKRCIFLNGYRKVILQFCFRFFENQNVKLTCFISVLISLGVDLT